MPKSTTYYKKKKFFIEAYIKSGCNVGIACNKVKISRATYYLWLRDFPKFKQEIEDAQESLIDIVETQALKQIKEGNSQMIIFYLKTKGKNRGYTERQEIVGDINFGLRESERLQKIVEELDDGNKQLKDSRNGKA